MCYVWIMYYMCFALCVLCFVCCVCACVCFVCFVSFGLACFLSFSSFPFLLFSLVFLGTRYGFGVLVIGWTWIGSYIPWDDSMRNFFNIITLMTFSYLYLYQLFRVECRCAYRFLVSVHAGNISRRSLVYVVP